MSIYTDGQRDLSDAAKLVNENTTVVTRYGPQPKKSFLRIQAEFEEKAEQTLKNASFTDAGFDFATGGTIDTYNQLVKDASGNSWQWQGSLPHVVTAGTDPTLSADWRQRTFNEIANISGLRDELDDRAIYLTLAEAQASNLKVGQYVKLTDRGGEWIVSTDTPNTFDILDLGSGLSLKYTPTNGVVHLSHLGFSEAATAASNRQAFERAKTLSKFITGTKGEYNLDYLVLDTDLYLTFAGRTATKLNITGFTTYNTLKCCVLNKGLDSLGLESLTNIEGVEIECLTTEASTLGMLITRKTNMTDVYIHGAVSDGLYFRAFNANTESPYFCNLTNVWSKSNGRDGIKFTDNCNANVLINCQADSNQGHGVVQTQVLHGDAPAAVYNNTIINGQTSYNQLHGMYVERGSEFIVSGTYAEFNSQIDGGNPKTGAYKNLSINNLAARCKCFLGSVGTSTDVDQVVDPSSNLSNEVYVGGIRVTPFDDIDLGYINSGDGKSINFYGEAGCTHAINFYEGTSLAAWLQYDGVPASPFNEISFRVNSGASPITYRTNGHLAFFGSTPVAKQSVSAAATDAATTQTLVNDIRTALVNLGLVG